MASLMDSIFGTQSSAQTTTLPTLSPQQQAVMDQLVSTLSTGGSSAITAPYTGNPAAPTNAVQGASLAAMEQSAMNAVAPVEAGTAALTDVMNQGPQDLSSYFKSTITDPAMQTFTQQILPAISQKFAGQSGFGSDKLFQTGIAAGNTATGIASAMGTASNTALQEQQQNKIQAALGLGTLQGTNANTLATLMSGGTQYQTAQNTPSIQYQQFLQQQQSQQTNLQDILASLGIQTQESQTVVTPGQPGLLQGAAQGLGTAGGVYAGTKLAGSDIRLKKNITRIGTHTLGIGIYLFQYIWGKWAIGVMAQELLPIKPEAVVLDASGYYMVDYAQL